jgi:hypothetical protein
LGIADYKLFDPERGTLGLAVNTLAVLVLWVWAKRVARRDGFPGADPATDSKR